MVQRFLLSEMKGGWFVGNFLPTCLDSREFEVACKSYKAGEKEASHVHQIAVELTLIVSGHVRMNEQEYGPGEIIRLDPGEPSDFCALVDTVTVVVKSPSVSGDKYLINNNFIKSVS